jgi:glycosyltransferase involved in cell wall biosynthesis
MKRFLEKYRKKLYRFFALPSVNRRFVRTPALFESFRSVDPAKLFVIVIAFNNADLVPLQNEALRKFLRDTYEYFVVDNSNDETVAQTIKGYCLAHGVNYARLPQNPGWGGTSHGLGLNWAYRNIVQKFKPALFGFIDHDVFPGRPVSVAKYLALGDAWGVTRKQRPLFRPWKRRWYLWPGLAFFRLEKFKTRAPNFLPAFRVDTGGRVEVDGRALSKLPDVHDFLGYQPMKEIVPGVRSYRYGDFIHFGGSWEGLPESLALKKRWMEDILAGKVAVDKSQ